MYEGGISSHYSVLSPQPSLPPVGGGSVPTSSVFTCLSYISHVLDIVNENVWSLALLFTYCLSFLYAYTCLRSP